MSARRLTGEATVQKTRGEIIDYYTEWTGRISAAKVSASGGTGAWFLAGETGSTANGSASALVGLRTTIRLGNNQSASNQGGVYTASSYYVLSARLVTNSAGGAAGSGQRFVQVFYLRVEVS